MKLSIVFSVFNKSNYTKQCLEKLLSLIDLNYYDIIIVNDGSTDNTIDILDLYKDKIHILNGDGSYYWSKSMNGGLNHAFNVLNSDYVVCWNNDIIPQDNYFDNLINIINNASFQNNLIGSKIYYLNPDNLIFTFGCYFNYSNGNSLFNGNKLINSVKFDSPIIADWCGGMGLTISKEIYRKTGEFDHVNFPQYKADSDYCLRSKKLGISLVCFPDLVIYNDVVNSGLGEYSQSYYDFFRSFTAINSTMNLKNNFNFIQKHCNCSYAYLYFLYTLFKYSIKYFYLRVKRN
jgi:GT2 family glycosyltransferase